MACISDVPADVKAKFEELALDLYERGFVRYSARAIFHRIRWHMRVERDERDYKLNNNWTAPLARWFADVHPECGDFFELRESKECA